MATAAASAVDDEGNQVMRSFLRDFDIAVCDMFLFLLKAVRYHQGLGLSLYALPCYHIIAHSLWAYVVLYFHLVYWRIGYRSSDHENIVEQGLVTAQH